jgi:hypothetical protein
MTAFCFIRCDCNGCRAKAQFQVKAKDGDHEYLMCARHANDYVGRERVATYKANNARPSGRKRKWKPSSIERAEIVALCEELFGGDEPEAGDDEPEAGDDEPTAGDKPEAGDGPQAGDGPEAGDDLNEV